MMNTYTSNTADIIRQDFLRFSTRTAAGKARKRVLFDADAAVDTQFTGSLEELRSEMANDDGQGTFASYKSIV